MSKRKATLVTVVIMALMSAVIFCAWRFAIRGFGAIEGLFAAYGYIRFCSDLNRWLQIPDAPILRSGKHRHW